MTAGELIAAMQADTKIAKAALARNAKNADALAKIDWDLKRVAASAASMAFAGACRKAHGELQIGHSAGTLALEKFYPDNVAFGPGGR
jgi:hypothetical protein